MKRALKTTVVTVKKPWGREDIFARAEGLYLGKVLTIDKGRRLSLQYHSRKHETLYVLRGKCLMEIRGRRLICRPGTAVAVPPLTRHRFCAPYGRVTLLEVSTYHPDDTIRVRDDYGR